MKPNLVFMFADQLRLCSTGYGGDKRAKKMTSVIADI